MTMGNDFCHPIKILFLEIELDNLFYRKSSKYNSYENKYQGWWDDNMNTYKVNCKNIPVYSFRYLNGFNKFF